VRRLRAQMRERSRPQRKLDWSASDTSQCSRRRPSDHTPRNPLGCICHQIASSRGAIALTVSVGWLLIPVNFEGPRAADT